MQGQITTRITGAGVIDHRYIFGRFDVVPPSDFDSLVVGDQVNFEASGGTGARNVTRIAAGSGSSPSQSAARSAAARRGWVTKRQRRDG